MQEQCRFCLGYHTQILSDSRRAYCCCYSCGGIGVLPEYYIPEKEQKARYLLHTNSLADTGYEQRLFFGDGIAAQPIVRSQQRGRCVISFRNIPHRFTRLGKIDNHARIIARFGLLLQ